MARPVSIMGGGLAGLTLGIGLRQEGVPVTIYESGDYPRHRVCGEFISGRGQAVLERLSLLADFEKAGAVYARTAVFISGTAKSPVRKLAAPALCLSRYKMDALLAAKFQELGGDLRVRSRSSGAGILPARPIAIMPDPQIVETVHEPPRSAGVSPPVSRPTIHDAGITETGHEPGRADLPVGQDARPRVPTGFSAEGIILATGRRLQPAENEIRWFGVKAHIASGSPVDLEADLEMHISPDGYVGINRVNDGEVNVCGLFRARPDKQRPESKMEWLLGQNDSPLRQRLKSAQFDPQSFCSVAGIQLRPRRAMSHDDCCIGDTLTMTPPVTGNGMSMAFESAEIAREPIVAYSRGEITWPEARRQIAARCDTAFSRRLAWARVLQWMMITRTVQNSFGKFLLQSTWLWQFMFDRTR